MGSFIIKAIQAFSKTERAQRLKAAIKAYRDHECLTTEPEQTPNLERDLETINELLVRHIDPELYSADDVEMAIESHSAKVAEAPATQWWDREIAEASTSQLEIALRSDPQIRTAQPTPEETEAFFDNLDFSMLEPGGSRLGNKFAKFNG